MSHCAMLSRYAFAINSLKWKFLYDVWFSRDCNLRNAFNPIVPEVSSDGCKIEPDRLYRFTVGITPSTHSVTQSICELAIY